MNQITIILYANLKEKAGTDRIDMQVPTNATIADLKKILKKDYPSLGPQLANVHVMVNKRNLPLETDVIPPNAEITFLPPISGG
jgi:molybdopterin converting factor small subunit